ncbi:MAG: phosphatase domain-containing protein, partial [Phormidesmis sp.]
DEIPHARVEIRLGEQQQVLEANEEGFFETELKIEPPLQTNSLWQTVDIKLLDPPPPKQSSVTTTGKVITVLQTAEFGVISDIDDTIVYTAANNLFKMIRIAYFGNERSRRLFEGVASFYKALQQGTGKAEGNPIFYVSSSPWNMYDLFDKFMALNDIPAGPILLRDIELSPENLLSFDHEGHKREQIDPIFRRFPDLPFVLIGDSGQKDAEIYSQIVEDSPDRILGVYIRDVLPENDERRKEVEAIAQKVRAAGVEFLLFSKTETAVKHAVEQGWITADWKNL